MNFLEICQRVFNEADRAPYTLNTAVVSDDTDEHVLKIVTFVKQAYIDIQRQSQHFTFLHTSGVLFETTADGTKDYSKTNVRRVLRDSLYCRVKATPLDDWPLQYLTFQGWRDMFSRIGNHLTDTRPLWFTELPNGQFRLEPGPDAVYEVMADWYIRHDVFEQDEDEPIWDEDLHDIVVWWALETYVNEYETPNELQERVMREKKRARQEFMFRYLPEMEIAGGDWP